MKLPYAITILLHVLGLSFLASAVIFTLFPSVLPTAVPVVCALFAGLYFVWLLSLSPKILGREAEG